MLSPVVGIFSDKLPPTANWTPSRNSGSALARLFSSTAWVNPAQLPDPKNPRGVVFRHRISSRAALVLLYPLSDEHICKRRLERVDEPLRKIPRPVISSRGIAPTCFSTNHQGPSVSRASQRRTNNKHGLLLMRGKVLSPSFSHSCSHSSASLLCVSPPFS